jgi:ubiquitin C-terminal hydrolase
MEKHKDRFIEEKNETACAYIELLDLVKNAKTYGDVFNSTPVLLAIVAATKKRDPSKKFGGGQEDSSEGLTLFLNAIDDKDLYNMFMYKYEIKRWCLECNINISESVDNSCLIEVPVKYCGIVTRDYQKKMDPLNLHILQNMSIMDSYKCPYCTNTTNFCAIYQLAHVPEILTVTFNKYHTKKKASYPQQLQFPTTGLKTVTYKLVSSIKHSGTRNGGHYWSNCYRQGPNTGPSPMTDSEPLADSEKKNTVYTLNDSNVSPGDFEPTNSTYILLYHIV